MVAFRRPQVCHCWGTVVVKAVWSLAFRQTRPEGDLLDLVLHHQFVNLE
jgi:hypothetical protein